MDNNKLIGMRIAAALAMRDKKQKDLAEAIGVTDNTISYFCGGKRTPNLKQIIAIAKELDVSTDYLLGLVSEDNYTRNEKLAMISGHTGLGNDAIEKLEDMKAHINARAWLDILNCIIVDHDFEYLLGVLEGYFADNTVIHTTLGMSSITVNPKDLSMFTASNALRAILDRAGERFYSQGYSTTDERLDKLLEEMEGKNDGSHS